MIFPIQLPDETLCSLLARLCRLNGIADFRDFAARYFGNPPYASFIDAHIDFPELCRRTDHAYGDPRAILEQLTWLGAQIRLGEVDASILVKIDDGTLMPSLSELTFHDSAVLSYCPTCRLRDISEFGISYWHRIHQLPVVCFCPQHGDPIVGVGIKRVRLHQAFPLPGDFELHQHGVQQTGMEVAAFWRGVASIVSEVFAAQILFEAETIDAALWDELRARKLVTSGGVLRKAEAIDLLLAHLFEIGNAEPASEMVIFSKRIVRSLTDQNRGLVLGRTILLNWLFGNWKAFEEKCNWIRVLGSCSKSSACNTNVSITRSELRMHHRKMCLDYMHDHPGCSRFEFTRAEYRSFRWLLHNDRAWLDKQLLVSPRGKRQLCLF